jgi:hypothetical protein
MPPHCHAIGSKALLPPHAIHMHCHPMLPQCHAAPLPCHRHWTALGWHGMGQCLAAQCPGIGAHGVAMHLGGMGWPCIWMAWHCRWGGMAFGQHLAWHGMP